MLFIFKVTDVHRRKQKCVKEKIKGIFIIHLENKCWPFGASMNTFLLSRRNDRNKAIVWPEEEKKKKKA